jgi:hypothetical protein
MGIRKEWECEKSGNVNEKGNEKRVGMRMRMRREKSGNVNEKAPITTIAITTIASASIAKTTLQEHQWLKSKEHEHELGQQNCELKEKVQFSVKLKINRTTHIKNSKKSFHAIIPR